MADGASREERRQRALEMLKAKPRPQQPQQQAPEAPPAEEAPTRPVAAARRRPVRAEERPAAPGRQEETRPVPAAEPAGRGDLLLEIENVNVHYGQIQGLRGINMAIRRGEVVALLGANGAGKSSTLRAISGMVSPSAGDIRFRGVSIAGMTAHQVVKHGIAHVPEGRELFPTLSVEENLRLGWWPIRKAGKPFAEQLDKVYTMFPRMAERRNQAAGTMSGGEQQMLVFGRALMSDPELLLVDEMSLGLAPLIVRTLFEAVESIHREGKSVILVEQFVHQALRHAQRAYVLAKGEVVLEAASEQLRNDPNLLAAYLGGAEGNVEEAAAEPKKKARAKKAAGKRPAAKAKS